MGDGGLRWAWSADHLEVYLLFTPPTKPHCIQLSVCCCARPHIQSTRRQGSCGLLNQEQVARTMSCVVIDGNLTVSIQSCSDKVKDVEDVEGNLKDSPPQPCLTVVWKKSFNALRQADLSLTPGYSQAPSPRLAPS